jgi:hypothetical protein
MSFSRCTRVPALVRRIADIQTNRGDTSTHAILRSPEGPGFRGPSDNGTHLIGWGMTSIECHKQLEGTLRKIELLLGPLKQCPTWSSYNLSNFSADSVKRLYSLQNARNKNKYMFVEICFIQWGVKCRWTAALRSLGMGRPDVFKYKEPLLLLYGYLKVIIALLLELQGGFTKYCSFLCLWDSRATEHRHVVKSGQRAKSSFLGKPLMFL